MESKKDSPNPQVVWERPWDKFEKTFELRIFTIQDLKHLFEKDKSNFENLAGKDEV